MSSTSQPIHQMPDRDRRVLLIRKQLRRTGNSIGISLPEYVFENVPFGLEDYVNFILRGSADEHTLEIALTIDPRKFIEQPGADNFGSRKISKNSRGTVMVTIPSELFADGMQIDKAAAHNATVRVTATPDTDELYLELEGLYTGEQPSAGEATDDTGDGDDEDGEDEGETD